MHCRHVTLRRFLLHSATVEYDIAIDARPSVRLSVRRMLVVRQTIRSCDLHHPAAIDCSFLIPTFIPCTACRLSNLHWLLVRKRIDFKLSLTTYKTLSTHQRAYLRSFLFPCEPTRALRSSSQQLLCLPTATTDFGSRAFRLLLCPEDLE